MNTPLSFSCFFNTSFFGENNGEHSKKTFQKIFNRAKKKVKRMWKKATNADEPIAFEVKIELTSENFENIILAFEEFEKAKAAFLVSLPSWSHSRRASISQLRMYAGKINNDRRYCNYTKAGSSSVGIVGGAVGVSALIFPPAAIVLVPIGFTIAGVSGATTIGTSITEMALLNKCMKKARATLQTDQVNFKPMEQWFKHAEELKKLIDQIIGFNVAEEIYQGLKDCKVTIENLFLNEDGELHPILKRLVDYCVEKITMKAIAAAATKEVLLMIPTIVAFFFVAILLHNKNNFMLGCVVASHRLVLGLMKTFDLGSDLGMLISNMAMKSGAVATKEVTKATAKIVGQGFVFGLGLGLDIANLVLTSKDIRRGSKSKKADDINTVADQLEKELQVLESIYKQLGGVPYDETTSGSELLTPVGSKPGPVDKKSR